MSGKSPKAAPMGSSAQHPARKLLHAVLIGAALLTAFRAGQWAAKWNVERGTVPADTLATYVFSNTEPEYVNNLRFFIQFGIKNNDGADYIILVQTGPNLKEIPLPALPPNARYVYHPNECYDWGSIGWLWFESGHVDTNAYKYFMILNSSVRGPFLPTSLLPTVPWHRLLTNRLVGMVKLVGPAISCEGTPFEGNMSNHWRINPHVQSYALATDQVGLNVMRREGNVFRCWNSRFDAIYYGELGSARSVLKAGYNLDSFMTRYQGVDWRDEKNWGCNAMVNPGKDFLYDGINVHPYEVMFVKFKRFMLKNRYSSAILPAKYERWKWGLVQSKQNVSGNAGLMKTAARADQKRALVDFMLTRGSKCFDFRAYRKENPDLRKFNNKQAWSHFVYKGQFEGRFHRFTCDDMSSSAMHVLQQDSNFTKFQGLCTCANLEFVPAAKWQLEA